MSRTLHTTVANLSNNYGAKNLAQAYGLNINSVSWEDTARTKGSCWGPNISDMTLSVDGTNMPMIRRPNFSDVTCDLSIDNFMVTVGNEIKEDKDVEVVDKLKRIPLKEYLQNISKYCENDKVKSMYLERDEHILAASQACVLPLKDGEVEFNVRLFNYQSSTDNPAVLVVVASSQGTSCQVVTDYQQKLYFNKAGGATNFLAKRLSDDRTEKGVSTEGAMTADEKDRNVLFVYQIPLKHKKVTRSYSNDSFGLECCMMSACAVPQSKGISRGMEDAVIRAGKVHSEFEGTKGLELERDDRYPIRCTLQYYKVTDTEEIPSSTFEELSEQLNRIYKQAEAKGSLVVEDSDRKTEKTVSVPEKEEELIKFDQPLMNNL